MTWTAPSVDREYPIFTGGELPSLQSWLEFHRMTLLTKCAGLGPEQLKERSVEPSPMSLLGLIRHMTDVERSWFRRRLDGQNIPPMHWSEDNPDGDFADTEQADAESDYAAYLAELDAARDVARRRSLEDTFFHDREKADISMRWVMNHMIEEYARHNGHADLLRERIDGVTGE
ncbi:MAG: DinB family protein [Frankiaceae bacterium]|nr:DinB family protein [Frankiaceae bacterium]MBV9870811.1 DinB family protein [Frankiaceae bacterium]